MEKNLSFFGKKIEFFGNDFKYPKWSIISMSIIILFMFCFEWKPDLDINASDQFVFVKQKKILPTKDHERLKKFLGA